jgi:choline monooxygenase
MKEDPFTFEPDIARAATIPSRWYRDPELLERERERLFGRTWQLAGRVDSLPGTGDFLTTEVAGEPLIVVRQPDGALAALSNVCRHRAGPVARGSGRRPVFQCGYHGWTYGLDGRLLSTPEFSGVEDFDKEAHSLPRFRVEGWGPFVFVNLDREAPPLASVLDSVTRETRSIPVERMTVVKQRDYEMSCNWKVYVDNYLEGYHIPMVHPALYRELDYASYRVETREQVSRQHAPIRREAETYRAAGHGASALYYWVFPNLMLNFYPDNLQVNLVLPLDVERTLTRFEWYLLEPERQDALQAFERSNALADQVQREDVAICEEVQRGLRSRAYSRGRYSVARENGVHHFHGLLSRFLRDGRDDQPSR